MGRIIEAKDVKAGEQLVGCKGTPVTVESVKAMRATTLWRISQQSGEAYLVTPEHRLTLRCCKNPRVVFRKVREGWEKPRVVLQYLTPNGDVVSSSWSVEIESTSASNISVEKVEIEQKMSEEKEEDEWMEELPLPTCSSDASDFSSDLHTPPLQSLSPATLTGTRSSIVNQIAASFALLPRRTYLVRSQATRALLP